MITGGFWQLKKWDHIQIVAHCLFVCLWISSMTVSVKCVRLMVEKSSENPHVPVGVPMLVPVGVRVSLFVWAVAALAGPVFLRENSEHNRRTFSPTGRFFCRFKPQRWTPSNMKSGVSFEHLISTPAWTETGPLQAHTAAEMAHTNIFPDLHDSPGKNRPHPDKKVTAHQWNEKKQHSTSSLLNQVSSDIWC